MINSCLTINQFIIIFVIHEYVLFYLNVDRLDVYFAEYAHDQYFHEIHDFK